MTDLKPCPFCGVVPTLNSHEECYGTCYELGCDECGIPQISIQMQDLMTIEERLADGFKDYQFGIEYIKRAEAKAVERWNTRSDPPAKLHRDMSIGSGTFRSGIPLETFLKAVDRQNPYFLRLMRSATPEQIVDAIVPPSGGEVV